MFKDIHDVFSFLTKEYGLLLPALTNCTKIREVDISLKKITYSPEWLKNVLEEDLSFYKTLDLPIILHSSNKAGSYTLIDGYHRFGLALSKNQSHIKAIILL